MWHSWPHLPSFVLFCFKAGWCSVTYAGLKLTVLLLLLLEFWDYRHALPCLTPCPLFLKTYFSLGLHESIVFQLSLYLFDHAYLVFFFPGLFKLGLFHLLCVYFAHYYINNQNYFW
jgi:hypothetical protein